MAAGDLSWWPHACVAPRAAPPRAEFCNFWVSFYRSAVLNASVDFVFRDDAGGPVTPHSCSWFLLVLSFTVSKAPIHSSCQPTCQMARQRAVMAQGWRKSQMNDKLSRNSLRRPALHLPHPYSCDHHVLIHASSFGGLACRSPLGGTRLGRPPQSLLSFLPNRTSHGHKSERMHPAPLVESPCCIQTRVGWHSRTWRAIR